MVDTELSTLGARWQRSSGKPTDDGDESIQGGSGTSSAARISSGRIVRRHSGAVMLASRHCAVDDCVAESRSGVADCLPDSLCEFSSSSSLRATS
eukprot:6522279-Prymnesium_polylepis.1